MNIPFAAKVSFGDVINITDAIGGVDVCIGNGGIQDTYTGIDWPAGTRTIQGIEALQFLRTRHGLENGSDLARISNQQQYMSRLARKLVSEEVLSNPATLLQARHDRRRQHHAEQEPHQPADARADRARGQERAVRGDRLRAVPGRRGPGRREPRRPRTTRPPTQLWAALAANQPIQLTSDPNDGGGVVTVDPRPTEPATPDPAATPGATAAPTEARDRTARLDPRPDRAQSTCSAGNVRGERGDADAEAALAGRADAARAPRCAGAASVPRAVRRCSASCSPSLGVSAAGVAAYTVWDTVTALGENAVVLDEDEVAAAVARRDRGRRQRALVGTDSCEGQDVALFPRCANDDAAGRAQRRHDARAHHRRAPPRHGRVVPARHARADSRVPRRPAAASTRR